MSYPHIIYQGYKLSLIEPFTVDDKLIIDINMIQFPNLHYDNRNYYSVKLKLDTMEYIMFELHNFDENDREINQETERIYLNYLNNISDNRYVIEECRHMLSYSDSSSIISHLLCDIRRQCSQCRTYGIQGFYNELTRQDRCNVNHNHSCITGYGTINTSYITSHYTNALSIDWSAATDYLGNYYHTETNKPKIIHTNSYIPTYKRHYVSGENKDTTLLFGAEIEVDKGGKSEEHAKKVLQIMNGEDTWDSEENIYCVHDGSLTNGLEFPTQPGSLEWHKTLPYKEMFEYLDNNGYKAHDTTTCGLHIHINRSFFGEQEKECIGKLMYIVEKFCDEFSIFGRRDCRYARLFGYNGEKCKELYDRCTKIRDKYKAINLLHKDTIEIRSFKGTLKYSTFINTLEFVSDLALYVKNHTEEEVENMEWSDLYNTFSDELKTYYDERKKIESEKKKTEKKELRTFNIEEAQEYYDRLATQLPSFCTSALMPISEYYESFIDTPTLTTHTDNDVSYNDRTYTLCFNGVNCNCSFSTNGLLSSISLQSERTEETNENKLKRLKNRLKTSDNYIEKKVLRQEINEVQKKIKQEKRKEKERKKQQKQQNNVTN